MTAEADTTAAKSEDATDRADFVEIELGLARRCLKSGQPIPDQTWRFLVAEGVIDQLFPPSAPEQQKPNKAKKPSGPSKDQLPLL